MLFLFFAWSTASGNASLWQADHTATITVLRKQDFCLGTVWRVSRDRPLSCPCW